MAAEKPNYVSLKELEQPSMNSYETFEWLKKQGLDFGVKWDSHNPKPVLLITTEKYREHVIKDVPSLLVTSFVIVRRPLRAYYNRGHRLYNTEISYSGLNESFGREYDVYSINPTNNEVLFVQPKYHDPKKVSSFQTELPFLILDDKNKKILEKLGCQFDW